MIDDYNILRARVEQAQALAAAATPGPWRSEGDTMTGGMDFRYVMIPLPVGTSVASGIIARCPRFGTHAHEAAANADLMAAAPDMAALVTDLWAEVERLTVENDERFMIERAAAAAKERAAVVAWVRDVAATASHNGDRCAGRIEEVADSIERGDHLEVASG